MPNLVSILIPAYNAEEWISDAIRSALDQTWPEKEIIIVDDGSSDNTHRTAKQFESGSVKVLTQENSGASAARNRALSIAQGDYIQWLDADDLLAPDKISRQLKQRDINPESRVLLSSAWGRFYFRKEKAKFISNFLWQDLTPVEWLLRKFDGNIWMIPAVWIVSRKLTELAGPWDERLSLDDDGEYFSRVLAASEKIKFVHEAKSYYRQANIGSLGHTVSDKACTSLYLSLSLSIGYLRQLEDSNRTRAACLKYLQRWLIYFYPEKTAILEKANALAKDLGGEMSPPALGWKYSIIKEILGWRMAKRAQRRIPLIKEVIRGTWDKFLYNVSNKKFKYRPRFKKAK
jgi:glycosyltransferase involved in cell wall biosynthesis